MAKQDEVRKERPMMWLPFHFPSGWLQNRAAHKAAHGPRSGPAAGHDCAYFRNSRLGTGWAQAGGQLLLGYAGDRYSAKGSSDLSS